MSESINSILTAAILKLLKPLVRVLLRQGISYGAFSDLAKYVYVDVAENDFSVEGKKQTVSRVSVITGLSRKEVSRVQKLSSPQDDVLTRKYNRAARVISGWVRDSDYHFNNSPTDLALDGKALSFSSLVKKYSGDLPVRAILDELLNVKAIALKDNKVKLLTNAYVPSGGASEKIQILGTDVALLLNTIEHNISNELEPAFYQRKVVYDNLPNEAVERFRELSHIDAQLLLEKMDGYLSKLDRDNNLDSQGKGRKRAGLGIYYFEEDVCEGKQNES